MCPQRAKKKFKATLLRAEDTFSYSFSSFWKPGFGLISPFRRRTYLKVQVSTFSTLPAAWSGMANALGRLVRVHLLGGHDVRDDNAGRPAQSERVGAMLGNAAREQQAHGGHNTPQYRESEEGNTNTRCETGSDLDWPMAQCTSTRPPFLIALCMNSMAILKCGTSA